MKYKSQNKKDPPKWFVTLWIIIFLLLFAYKTFSQDRGGLPVINQKMLHYIDSVKGIKVGEGVCWEFVYGALNYAGAKTEMTKRFGNLFTKNRYIYYGEPIKQRDARPGDIIDFCMGHNAIIYKKITDFEFLVAHQNISPLRVVEITPLCTDCLDDKWGACHLFYRPVLK